MANTTGKNSPSSFNEFTPKPQYGTVKQRRTLERAAPLAGQGGLLGTHRAAAEQAASQAPPAPASPRGPVAAPQVPSAPDPYRQVWIEAAQQPGASPLVKAYAARL